MRVSIRYPGLGSVGSSNSSSVNQYYGEVSGGLALLSAGSSQSSGSFGPGSGSAGESIGGRNLNSTLTFPRRVGEGNQSMSPPPPPPPSPRSQSSFGGPGSTTSPRPSTWSSGPVGSGSGTGTGTGTGPGPGPRFSTGASGGLETPLRKRRRCSYTGSSGSSSGNGSGSGSGPSNSSGTGLRNSVNSHSHPNRGSWQATMSSMSERIRHNFNRPDMSDITFLVGQDKTPIYAHKTLFCFSSPVFQAQFMGSLSNQASTEEIPDIQADVFLNFLSVG